MKEFRIVIYNWSNIVVYDEIIKSENENKAIIEILKDITICSDDTIKIEEV